MSELTRKGIATGTTRIDTVNLIGRFGGAIVSHWRVVAIDGVVTTEHRCDAERASYSGGWFGTVWRDLVTGETFTPARAER